jgi:hypothetical protein
MRRPCADREEKRVTHANETKRKKGSTGQLDFDDPNQRRLSDAGAARSGGPDRSAAIDLDLVSDYAVANASARLGDRHGG